ncbi:unnamed protein product [Malus baccata var. baccata]
MVKKRSLDYHHSKNGEGMVHLSVECNSTEDGFPSRFHRSAGPIPSSMLGLEAMTKRLNDFGFEDYLTPRESETLRPVDTSCNGSSPWAFKGDSLPKLYVILVDFLP